MTPQVALLLAILLAGIPAGAARGGKAGKGSGGGIGGYNGISNSGTTHMTWEDMVLAMQLTAMCFGALFAVCVVGCCAYKICGPAEEVEWGSQYSVLKPARRQPPEILREIYTVPASSASTATTASGTSKDHPVVATAVTSATPTTPKTTTAPTLPPLPSTPATPKSSTAPSPRPTWKMVGVPGDPPEDEMK